MNIYGWTCKKCGQHNSMFNGLCKSCGDIFTDENGCCDAMVLDQYLLNESIKSEQAKKLKPTPPT